MAGMGKGGREAVYFSSARFFSLTKKNNLLILHGQKANLFIYKLIQYYFILHFN